MSKTWNEVQSSPEYQSLNAQDKAAAQSQYFDEVVKPQLSPEDVDAAHNQFFQQYPIGSTQNASQPQTAQSQPDNATGAENGSQSATGGFMDTLAGMGRIAAGTVSGIANIGVGAYNTLGNTVQSISNDITGESGQFKPMQAAGYGKYDEALQPRGVEKAGSDVGTFLAGGEILAPARAAEAATEVGGFLGRLASGAMRNFEGSAAGTLSQDNQGNPSDVAADLAVNTVSGMALEGVGNTLIRGGSAARRAVMGEAREADAMRNSRIANISDDAQFISQAMPSLEGQAPKDILSNPDLVNSFRKPNESPDVFPERLETAFKGIYGNESGDAMARAYERGEAPQAASKSWQDELNANYNQPIDSKLASRATQRLENEFNQLERSRPEISMNRLDEINQAYRNGGVGVGSLMNPALPLSVMSDRTLQRLGVSGAQRAGLAAGEGAESSLFGLGQLTRQYNQKALNAESNAANAEAVSMGSRKGEGSRLSQQTLDAMADQHAQLTAKLQPQIDEYHNALAKQSELTDKLNQNLSPEEHISVLQQLNNVSDDVRLLKPNADLASTTLAKSTEALQRQSAKAGEAVTVSNAYSKAAKQGESYLPTRNQSNYGARNLMEAESLTKGGLTKGYDEAEYSQQLTPREIMEAREETSALRDKASKQKHTAESKSLGLLHWISHGATFIPHLAAVGYSRMAAKSIMDDLARTGGKNLKADELRDVIAVMAQRTGQATTSFE